MPRLRVVVNSYRVPFKANHLLGKLPPPSRPTPFYDSSEFTNIFNSMRSSLVRIPFIALAMVGVQMGTTPPHPPPNPEENAPSTSLEIVLKQRSGAFIFRVSFCCTLHKVFNWRKNFEPRTFISIISSPTHLLTRMNSAHLFSPARLFAGPPPLLNSPLSWLRRTPAYLSRGTFYPDSVASRTMLLQTQIPLFY